MNEQAFFTKALTELYELTVLELRELNTHSLEDERTVYHMYHIVQGTAHSHVVFAYYDDFIHSQTYSWGSNLTLVAWLQQRATLLTFLAQQNYPAPRVLPSKANTLICTYQQWNIVVTTFIDGLANELSPENMFLLAYMLGQLHTLSFHPAGSLGSSWWNTTYSIPHALEMLNTVASSVPITHKNLYETIYRTLHMLQDSIPRLPETIIHGDCWAPNAVRSAKQEVVLIDWECAGRGAAILDLGALLLRCQYNQHGEIPTEVEPTRITSVISGYVQWRRPVQDELDILLEAIRFSIAWGGAWIFTRANSDGWSPKIERLLARIQRGYNLAEPIAHLALVHLAQA